MPVHECEHRLSGYHTYNHALFSRLDQCLHMEIALGTMIPLLSFDKVVVGRLGHIKVADCV